MDDIQLSAETVDRINQQAAVFGEKFEEIVNKLNEHYDRLTNKKNQLEKILQELKEISDNAHPNDV